MNDYLGKESNEAASRIFSLLRRKIDIQKKMGFQFLHSNVNISKFGYQQDRQLNGFLGLDSEDLEDKASNQMNAFEDLTTPQSGKTESELESDSEEEQMELNRRLKEGKSGGKGILLGEDSMQANARVVAQNEDEFQEITDEEFKGNHFESFENGNKIPENSEEVNPLFKNQEKQESGEEDKMETHEIEVNDEQNANEFPMKLSFGNDSFNKNGSGVEPESLRIPMAKKINVESEKGKINSSFEVEEKKFGKGIDHLLSSKTLGERSPKVSSMYQER